MQSDENGTSCVPCATNYYDAGASVSVVVAGGYGTRIIPYVRG